MSLMLFYSIFRFIPLNFLLLATKKQVSFYLAFWSIPSLCLWSLSPYTYEVCIWTILVVNHRYWPAGGSELWQNIWGQLGRVCSWTEFNRSTIGTCRIGGLRPFGKAIVGSRRVSDMKVSGVSQQMIQERWSWDSRLAGSDPMWPVFADREERERRVTMHDTLLFRHTLYQCSF